MSKKTKRNVKKSSPEFQTAHRSNRWFTTSVWAGLGVLIVGGALFLLFRGPEVKSAAQGNLKAVPSVHYESHNHIHGMGYDSQNGRLFVATHYGLFVWKEGRLFQYGDSRDDFMGFSLVPTDPTTIFTSGHPRTGGNMGVMKSEDGGMTFKSIFRGLSGENVDFHSMAVSPVNPKILYGWFNRKLYRSKDGGKSWQFPAARGLPSQGFCWGGPCFSADTRNEQMVYSGTPDGLLVSRDYGESWTKIPNELGAVAAVGVHPTTPQWLFVFADRLGLALSQDEGKSWKSANDGLGLTAKEFVFAFSFDHSNPDQIFAATGEHILRSTNRGKSWQKIL